MSEALERTLDVLAAAPSSDDSYEPDGTDDPTICWRCALRPAGQGASGVCAECREILLAEAYTAPEPKDDPWEGCFAWCPYCAAERGERVVIPTARAWRGPTPLLVIVDELASYDAERVERIFNEAAARLAADTHSHDGPPTGTGDSIQPIRVEINDDDEGPDSPFIVWDIAVTTDLDTGVLVYTARRQEEIQEILDA